MTGEALGPQNYFHWSASSMVSNGGQMLGINYLFTDFSGWSSTDKQMLLRWRDFQSLQTNQSKPAAALSILNQYTASLWCIMEVK